MSIQNHRHCRLQLACVKFNQSSKCLSIAKGHCRTFPLHEMATTCESWNARSLFMFFCVSLYGKFP